MDALPSNTRINSAEIYYTYDDAKNSEIPGLKMC